MVRQKYGIGTQHFPTLIERNFVYVDKTQYIIKLLEGSDLYFLSRPRRFGKSLFLSTLEQFFRARRDLFKGLAIDSYPWNWEEYPVIKISFGQGNFLSETGVAERIDQILSAVEREYGCKSHYTSVNARFSDLIFNLYRKFNKGVVILIDEYEKPLLDTYGEKNFESNRSLLAEFYSVFKDNTDKIRMLFITGVTRFGRLNIFSGLNSLKDISLSEHFSAICGITQQELESNFLPGVENLASRFKCSPDEALRILKENYDGYHFSGELIDVYNPWSLLNCLDEGRLVSEWIKTGASTYLLNILRKRHFNLTKLLGASVRESDLDGMDSEMMDPITLLYQSGYLTVKSYDVVSSRYEIGLPNHEVKIALMESIVPFYLNKSHKLDDERLVQIFNYIENGEAEAMMQWFAAYFSKISFYSKLSFEKDFHMIMLCIFLLVRDFKHVHMEYAMSSGRTDLVVEAKDYVYIFEFKIGDNPDKAIEQINSRGYALPWSADGRKVFKIGAAFSTESNGILRYKIEE